ncbi:MAG: hypothetical protein M1820_006091 [Bogoriella megaspora]|nr:MAG: hypothetical protein M1820_006091 [Bogoriella megaspora]
MATPLTPREENEDLPRNAFNEEEVPYNETFENELANAVRNPQRTDGTRVVYGDTVAGENEKHVKDIDTNDWRQVSTVYEDEPKPLSLDDHRRKFQGPVPGVQLTHPNGALEGGPSRDPASDAAELQALVNEHQIKSKGELKQKLEEGRQEAKGQLEACLEARQKAIDHNEKIDKEIQQLVANRELEIKVLKREKVRKEERKKARAEANKDVEGGSSQMTVPFRER